MNHFLYISQVNQYVYELGIETVNKASYLNLTIWDDDSGYVHTQWPVCSLHNSEVSFKDGGQGGRFRTYRKDLRDNQISFCLGSKNGSLFATVLTWIADNIETEWSFDFAPHPAEPVGGPFPMMTLKVDLRLYFENIDDAVWCKLKFA